MPKILVVEDNKQNRKLARTLLELDGHEVIEAEDVDQAEAILATQLPAIALVDIQLPGRDGVDLLRSIRADERLRDLKVVAMTAYAMRGDQQRFLAHGFDGYISKPVDTQAFPLTIARLLRPTKAGEGGKVSKRAR